jgi:hypothetical protein
MGSAKPAPKTAPGKPESGKVAATAAGTKPAKLERADKTAELEQ